jgi:2-iminobutanoate/2-iminopropanoate deaminase
MEKTAIHTPDAPQAIGPYSQAIKTGDFLFCSGQIPLSPATGEVVSPQDVRGQVTQVMSNIKAVLHADGLDFRHVVKTTIFVTDLADFGAVNEIYGSYFQDTTPPARSTVQVAALPRGVKVEVEVIAQRA